MRDEGTAGDEHEVGLDAHGDEGPDLHELEISDRRIVNVIKHCGFRLAYLIHKMKTGKSLFQYEGTS